MKIKEIISKIEKYHGDLFTSKDLIDLGFIKAASKLTILRNRNGNFLPHFKFTHGAYRYHKKDLLDFIEPYVSNRDGDREYEFENIFLIRPIAKKSIYRGEEPNPKDLSQVDIKGMTKTIINFYHDQLMKEMEGFKQKILEAIEVAK